MVLEFNSLRGDLFLFHVTGAQKHLLCLSVGRLIRKDGRVFYLQNKTKIKRFWKVRQRERDARSSAIFAYITANMAVISNISDDRILIEQNLVSDLCFSAARCNKKYSSVNKL